MIDALVRSIFVSLIGLLIFSLVYGWDSVQAGSFFVGFFLGTFTYWGGKAWWKKKKKNASK